MNTKLAEQNNRNYFKTKVTEMFPKSRLALQFKEEIEAEKSKLEEEVRKTKDSQRKETNVYHLPRTLKYEKMEKMKRRVKSLKGLGTLMHPHPHQATTNHQNNNKKPNESLLIQEPETSIVEPSSTFQRSQSYKSARMRKLKARIDSIIIENKSKAKREARNFLRKAVKGKWSLKVRNNLIRECELRKNIERLYSREDEMMGSTLGEPLTALKEGAVEAHSNGFYSTNRSQFEETLKEGQQIRQGSLGGRRVVGGSFVKVKDFREFRRSTLKDIKVLINTSHK